LSETAFARPSGENEFSLRWFTPTVEVPLCGHATLASAHVLWEDGLVSPGERIVFHPREGKLEAQRESDWICLDFPAIPVEESTAPAGLAEAVGAQPMGVHWNPLRVYLVELETEKAVRGLEPDFAKLRSDKYDACIVTARADSDPYDFVSRFFAVGFGIDEDPVTGMAHCSLGPFWAERLGKTEVVGYQASKRGGVVRVRPRGDRVNLLGQAVTVMRSELLC
jgi:PhzF family phenazine biosynthesis protein